MARLFRAPTTLTAIAHHLPIPGPFFTPRKLQPAEEACLSGQILFFHTIHGRCLIQGFWLTEIHAELKILSGNIMPEQLFAELFPEPEKTARGEGLEPHVFRAIKEHKSDALCRQGSCQRRHLILQWPDIRAESEDLLEMPGLRPLGERCG